MNNSKPPRWLSILIMVAIIVLMVVLFINREKIQQLEQYGYLGIFLISIAANATVILPLPGVVITSTMGAIFNPLLVAIAAGIGAAIGELTGYAAGYSSQTVLADNAKYQKLVEYMRTHPK